FLNRFIPGKSTSFEFTFVEMATKAQMEIHGLESVQDQLSIFDQISYSEQAKDVKDMLHNEQKYLDLYDDMIELYKLEDMNALYHIVAEGMDGENEAALLLDKRNQAWIAEISTLAKAKPTFFGVGAAHLGGEQGVIELLKKAGYSITPVE
ncbi:MAG: TraB/GumN family protein, partial [Bacteroidota bacterium]